MFEDMVKSKISDVLLLDIHSCRQQTVHPPQQTNTNEESSGVCHNPSSREEAFLNFKQGAEQA